MAERPGRHRLQGLRRLHAAQRGTIHERYRGRGELTQRLLLDERRVPLSPFVQFGIVAPGHMQMVVQAALRRYANSSDAHP